MLLADKPRQNRQYLWNGKTHELHTWYTDGECYQRVVTSNLKALKWLFKSPLAGGGDVLWQPHYSCTACYFLLVVCMNTVPLNFESTYLESDELIKIDSTVNCWLD